MQDEREGDLGTYIIFIVFPYMIEMLFLINFSYLV